ncbi:6-phosphogluconolactonase [Rhodosalinus halophilus]|uniref:6-phosphogluconolactonase n=1 Tax=Rhodosalinus halophilus TaxID=2259333 RepID=A0A365U444_9RHOB|nr:6-phosphogluconolactonase [Rhodosalinus halophilus]RBI82868.1 6-phosphogluconolactonase [Rhodosalinus halophilus]
MEIVEYVDPELMAIDLANRLAGELRAALSHSGRVLFAVPGGSTPGPVFDALCAAQIDWASVDVLLTDERWVRPDHPRSNTRLVRERLLVDRAARATLLPMYQPTDTPEAAVARVIEAITPHLPIAVLLLGMGEDGHVASLFPGSEGLEAALAEDAPPVVALRPPEAEEPRLTLTRPVLDGALSKHLAITGAAKREALERAQGRPESEAPVRALFGGLTVHWAP